MKVSVTPWSATNILYLYFSEAKEQKSQISAKGHISIEQQRRQMDMSQHVALSSRGKEQEF